MAVAHLLISFASGVDVRELTKLSSDLSSVLPTVPLVSTTVTSRLPTSRTHLMTVSAISADDVSSGSHFHCIMPGQGFRGQEVCVKRHRVLWPARQARKNHLSAPEPWEGCPP